MKLIDIMPDARVKLYDALVRKEDEIRSAGRGTFYRAGPSRRNSASWKHKAYPGRVELKRQSSGAVSARIKSAAHAREWQMMSAFLGFVDRHFGDKVSAINIRYH